MRVSAADFISACHDVLRERRTGVLAVQAEGIRTFVYFKEGVLVFAEQGSLGETLGRILVRQGTLTLAQYTAILERMTEELIQSEQARFGEVAIQLGFLTPEQVDEALREQVRRKFVHCLQWEISTCTFTAGDEEIGGLPRYPMPFEPLLLDGVRQHFDDERCAAVLGPLAGLYPEVREDAETLARRFQLDARGLRLLRALDGTRTLRATLDAAAAGLETRPLLVSLVICNTLRMTVGPVAPRGPGETRAGAAEPRPREDAALFVPTPPPAPAAPSPAPTPKRPPPEPPKDRAKPPLPATDVRVARLEAERAFQHGRRLLAEESWGAAARELRRAATLYAEPLEYELAAAWAELRAGTEGADKPERRAALRRLAERAGAQDRGLALAQHVIGHLAALDGDHEVARRCLQAVLVLEPSNLDAQRTLRLAQRRAGAGGGTGAAAAGARAAPPAAPAPPRGKARAGGKSGAERVLDDVMVARSSGDLQAAITLLRDALLREPDCMPLVAELSLCVLLADPRRNAREANGLARRARTADPHLPLPWVVAGMLLEPLGEKDRAAQLYRHALTLDPECADAQTALDRLLSARP